MRHVPGVALVDDRGALLRLDAPARDEVLVLGYTRCTDQCPLTLANVAVALRELTPNARPAAYFVTVDPTHDDGHTLRHYLGAWNNTIVGVTGAPPALNAVALALGAGDASRSPGDHDTRLFIVDHFGAVRQELSPDATPTAIVQALRADT
ncbi:MAG: SCO family protein [Candidatus Eremiobacteraeota bacterium]|nr:SCO family protein [Candidatus Eremiobacteraeota bacterium]